MDFAAQADALIEKETQVCRGIPTLDQIEEIGQAFVKQLVKIAKDAGLLGPEAKQQIEEYVRKFYAAVIEPIDLPGPDVIVDKYLLNALLMFAGWAFDEVVG